MFYHVPGSSLLSSIKYNDIQFRGYVYALYAPAKKRETVWETSPSLISGQVFVSL